MAYDHLLTLVRRWDSTYGDGLRHGGGAIGCGHFLTLVWRWANASSYGGEPFTTVTVYDDDLSVGLVLR